MHKGVEIPQEAVEAVAKSLYEDAMLEFDQTVEDDDGDGLEPEGIWTAESDALKRWWSKKAAVALQAALPAISSALRTTYRAELEEELLGEEAVEETARQQVDDALRQAGLTSAPEDLWNASRKAEETAWFRGRDDTVSHIEDELSGLPDSLGLALLLRRPE